MNKEYYSARGRSGNQQKIIGKRGGMAVSYNFSKSKFIKINFNPPTSRDPNFSRKTREEINQLDSLIFNFLSEKGYTITNKPAYKIRENKKKGVDKRWN